MNNFQIVLFYVFAGFAVASALLVVLSRKTVYGVLALAGGMICLSGLFVLLEAYFVAVIQVLIYAGAILVLFLFVMMLMGIEGKETRPVVSGRRFWMNLVLAAAFFGPLTLATVAGPPFKVFEQNAAGTVEAIAGVLFSEYLLPFELVSGVLLIGIIGVVSLAQRERGK